MDLTLFNLSKISIYTTASLMQRSNLRPIFEAGKVCLPYLSAFTAEGIAVSRTGAKKIFVAEISRAQTWSRS